MKKVIESNGKFFVKEYNENGDSVAISAPFDSQEEADATLIPGKSKKEKEIEDETDESELDAQLEEELEEPKKDKKNK